MNSSETITKVFCNGDKMPLQIEMPARNPIPNFETENIKIIDCYTTGGSISYFLRQIKYGIEGVVFGEYTKAY